MQSLVRVGVLAIILGIVWLVAVSAEPNQPGAQAVRVASGIVVFLLLPGLTWSWVFWPPGTLDALERGVLAITLSLALLSLAVFTVAKAGVRPSTTVLALTAAAVEALGILLAARHRTRRRRPETRPNQP
jgi:uncharacterized membrane protein